MSWRWLDPGTMSMRNPMAPTMKLMNIIERRDISVSGSVMMYFERSVTFFVLDIFYLILVSLAISQVILEKDI